MFVGTDLSGDIGVQSSSFEKAFLRLVRIAAWSAVALLVTIAAYLITQSLPLWSTQSPLSFISSTTWAGGLERADGTVIEVYGAAAPLFGTAVTSLIAVMIAAPIGILGAVYLVEYAPKPLAISLTFIVELIAAIPSVVFGLWAFGDLSARLRDSVEWWIASTLGQFISWLSEEPGSPASDNVFRAGVVLAVMILPMIVAVSREFLRSVPTSLREGYVGMGATKWEAIREVVLPTARIGLFGAVMLALGRAMGETIAVTMVIGNAPGIPSSLLLPGSTVATRIANDIAEVTPGTHQAALVGIGLSLFLLTFVVSVSVRIALRRYVLAKVAA